MPPAIATTATNTRIPIDAPLITAGNGNGFPAPPECLHKLGRFGGTRAEPGGVDRDVENASHQQFDRKSATSPQFLKPLLTK